MWISPSIWERKPVETEEHFPITMVRTIPDPVQRTGGYPVDYHFENTVDEQFKGTGFNPEGPPGQEGQTPPAYKDLEGLVGEYSNERKPGTKWSIHGTVTRKRAPGRSSG